MQILGLWTPRPEPFFVFMFAQDWVNDVTTQNILTISIVSGLDGDRDSDSDDIGVDDGDDAVTWSKKTMTDEL